MANEETNREALYNDKGEFILHFFPLDEKHVLLWDDLLEDDEKGRLLDAIWHHELKETGSYDDSKESKGFRACLGQFRRDCLPGARISAEKNYMKRSKGGKNSHKGQASNDDNEDDEEEKEKEEKDGDNKDLSAFKPPSKTAFRDLAFEVVQDLIQQGKRTDKISSAEANSRYDYFKAAKWLICRDCPFRSIEEIKALLYCYFDNTLNSRLQYKGIALSAFDLCGELLIHEELQRFNGGAYAGILAFDKLMRRNSLGEWEIANKSYNDWRAAWNAFIDNSLRKLKNA